ncbi:unnamed protein product [Ectocarpus sp. CCAP 1310/34]|nr:unnamed protein product [Ectocarpus sp. CCAP 1310/34]
MAGDKGDGDVPTPERSQGEGNARAANDQPGKPARTAPQRPGFDVRNQGRGPPPAPKQAPSIIDRGSLPDIFPDGELASPSSWTDGVLHGAGMSLVDTSMVSPEVVRAPLQLQLHQNELFERIIVAMDDPKFASNRAKMGGIAREVANAKDMGGDASTDDLRKRPLTDSEMREGEIEVFDRTKDYGGQGAAAAANSSPRERASSGERPRGERRPCVDRPGGSILVLVGADAINEVGTETYAWRTGDPHRSSREPHEAILALVFLGGLVWCPESIALNQKVGGTFNDDQRSRGGNFVESWQYGVDEKVWKGQREPTAKEEKLVQKKRDDSSAGGSRQGVWEVHVHRGVRRARDPGPTTRRGPGCVGRSREASHDPPAGRRQGWPVAVGGGRRPGRSLKGDEGVVFLTEWQASQIVKEHNDLNKEWLKKNPNN